ncbi:unnamed protein product, partial [Heterosigma akashiwo]
MSLQSKIKQKVQAAQKKIPSTTPGGNDGRFFSTTKKGETHELRQEL